jgi:hypothetical protein
LRLSPIAVLLVAVAAAQPPGAGQGAEQRRPLRIIAFGAHPNDAELKASGVVARWVADGHKVKFVAMTHGHTGHMEGPEGPRRRAPEVAACARILGTETQVFDIPLGTLTPSLENRQIVARLIRQWQADIVLGHRPYDETDLTDRRITPDPDIRQIGVLLDDSAATVVAPSFMPGVPPTPRTPIYMYYSDSYRKPSPFDPTIVAGFDAAAKKKWKCVQNMPVAPADLAGTEYDLRLMRVKNVKKDDAELANMYRERLAALYGAERGRQIRYAEAFELSKHGRQATVDELLQLFPR